MTTPLVSIVMPVYNAEQYLAEAISSILAQSYGNFELIILDDGSTDGSAAIIAGYGDPRIRTVRQVNRGLSPTLNRGIEMAAGCYLARQDADDVSFPERLARQVEFLEEHPDCCMVGTWAEIWVEGSRTERSHRHPAENSALKLSLLFDNYFVHSSVMLRRSALDQVGCYTTAKKRQPEDYDLWSRLLREERWSMANIPEFLLAYREVEGSICRSDERSFLDEVLAISVTNLAHFSGRPATDPAVNALVALMHHAFDRVPDRPRLFDMLAVLSDASRTVSGGAADHPLRREKLLRTARIAKAYYLKKRQVLSRDVRQLLRLPSL